MSMKMLKSSGQQHRPKDPAPLELLGGMGSATKENIMRDLAAFIAASPKGDATLVLMGDSTVTGLVDELIWNVTENVHSVPVYVANDRPKSVMFGVGDEAWIKPGDDWAYEKAIESDDSGVVRMTVERARAATRVLHESNCTWSGGLETYVWRHEELPGLVMHHWGFLPEYGDACWKTCFADAMRELGPNTMMWNIGYHLLNRNFESDTCSRRTTPGKENCGDYEQMVEMGTRELSQSIPNLIWRTTNFLCEDKQTRHQPELIKWSKPELRTELEEQCHESCPGFDTKTCYDWFFCARATELQRNMSIAAIEKRQREPLSDAAASFQEEEVLGLVSKPVVKHQLNILDAYTISKQCCERGCDAETNDGEHYRGLDRDLLAELASMMALGVSQ